VRSIVVVDDGSPSVARARTNLLIQNTALFVPVGRVAEHSFAPVTAFITPVTDIATVPLSSAGVRIAFGEAEQMERAFLLGVDDYLCEPWTVRELIVRTHRAGFQSDKTLGHVIEIGGNTVVLSDVQAAIWSVLNSRPGRAVSRHDLACLAGVNAEGCGDASYEGEQISRAVDMHIHRIRHALGNHRNRIETVRGHGYRLSPEKINNSNLNVDK
jgi:DNA-binding winged helix-turn-helix (wHTH) protein